VPSQGSETVAESPGAQIGVQLEQTLTPAGNAAVLAAVDQFIHGLYGASGAGTHRLPGARLCFLPECDRREVDGGDLAQ